jgi:hypothetical protein
MRRFPAGWHHVVMGPPVGPATHSAHRATSPGSMPGQSQQQHISGCRAVRVSFCLGATESVGCHQQGPGTRRETERTAEASGCGTADRQSFMDFDHLPSPCNRVKIFSVVGKEVGWYFCLDHTRSHYFLISFIIINYVHRLVTN